MGAHEPVLLEEALRLLDVRPGGTYLDLTLGRGGHSEEILHRLQGTGLLLSFDVDPEAIEEGGKRLSSLPGEHEVVRANFRDFLGEIRSRGIGKVDGILADLGVSSPQFDEGERGFSYRTDAPLDMRMDPEKGKSAARLLEELDERSLRKILLEYGEEHDASRIARLIVRRREEGHPVRTTGELVDLVREAKGPKGIHGKGHPAKQTFQALRIAVNDELGALEDMLRDIPEALALGGVAAIITFHSLEDRLVKRRFRALSRVEGSRHHPVDEVPSFEDLTPRPILPSEEEVERNRRAKSAKLRAIRRIRP